MNYVGFLDLRRPLWDRFEEGLKRARRGSRHLTHDDLEALAFDYRQVLHDRALAGQRFAGTEAERRLRRLAADGTRLLVRDSAVRAGGVLSFYLTTFPRTFRRHLPTLGIAVALFLAVGALGLALSIYSPALGVSFIGPNAVTGMEEGRLWTESLTTTVPPVISSSGIATNNMSVGLMAWAGGAVAGVLSLWVLFLNGLMLGSVIGVTLHYSMAGPLFEFIAAHGPLEISLILICAGAGLVMARGMVVAEDRPRSQVLQEAARQSLTLLLGVIPWFLVLGFVEGFISPNPDVPIPLKAAVGGSLEVLFLLIALNPWTSRSLHG